MTEATVLWVSPKEAAERFNVSRWTVLNWIRQDRVKYIRAGYKTIRISLDSVEKMMEENKQETER